MTANLTLREGLNEQPRHIHTNRQCSNDYQRLAIVRPVISENDSVDDASPNFSVSKCSKEESCMKNSQVAKCASEPRNDTVRLREDMRDVGKVGAIAGFEEKCHAGNQSDQS